MLKVKILKIPTVTIFVISFLLLQVLIVGVLPVAATPQGPPNNWSAQPPIHVRIAATSSSPTGLSPTQIRAVYNLPSTGGSGTIAIVDAYDDPTVENDLNVFSSQFGLPPITSANFEKHMMSPPPGPNGGWALEISLDVQWAHAIAPDAKILLVEARSSSLTDLLAAVDYARTRSDVVAVSMSWGDNDFPTESSYDSHFISPYGATFFASSGDSGAGVSWPAASPNVVGVGGTTLNFNPDNSLASETAWSGSGGGVSAYENEPPYQVAYNVPGAHGKRAVPDVSYNANPNSGVSVYDNTPYQGQTGWWQVGGTSAGAPQWAAIQSLELSASNNNFYQDAKSVNYPSYFRDITSGSNGYPATIGYDLVTGLGSPLTDNFVPKTYNVSVSISPSYENGPNNATLTYTVTVNNTGDVSDNYILTYNDNAGWSPSLSKTSIVVAPGASDNTTTLSVTIPSDAIGGTVDNIKVTATSQTDNTVSGSSGCTAQAAIFEVALRLVPGWNLVSFPVDNVDMTPANVFPDLTYLDDYRIIYWPALGGPYRTQPLNAQLLDNTGYWVWIDRDNTVTTSGARPASENVYLENGWNLVCFTVTNENTTPNNLFPGLTYLTDYRLQYWVAPGGPFKTMPPNQVLEDNRGDWVWIDRKYTVTVP